MHTPYKYTIYHPNGKGNGSALSLELYKASERNVGKVILSISPQNPAVSDTGKLLFPSFDWKNRTAVRLEAVEVEKMIEVLEGKTESINDEKGLISVKGGISTTFSLRHVIGPDSGHVYEIEIERRDGDNTTGRAITLTPTEGGMLYHGLTASMGLLMFG